MPFGLTLVGDAGFLRFLLCRDQILEAPVLARILVVQAQAADDCLFGKTHFFGQDAEQQDKQPSLRNLPGGAFALIQRVTQAHEVIERR